MKVIFLDFDGVLNSQGSFINENRKRKRYMDEHECTLEEAYDALGKVNESFDPVNAAMLSYLMDAHPDAKIVYSTTWRNLFDMEWLAKKLQEYHIDSSRVIGRTPNVYRGFSSDRTLEIARYLDEHPEVTNYVILDDAFIGQVYAERHVQTDWERDGLNVTHAREAIAMLSHPMAPREPKEEHADEQDSGD